VAKDATGADDVAAVGDLERFADLVVGDQDRDVLVAQSADDLLDAGDGNRVDARKRLIQEDDLGVGDEAAGDFQPAAFPAGKRHGQRLSQVGDVELFEQLVTSLQPLLAVDSQHLHHAQQILFDRELAEHAGFLGEVSHPAVACPAVHGPVGHVDATESDLAFVGFDHAAGHAEAGGFSGAIGSQQPDDFAGLDTKIDSVDHPTRIVGLYQSLDFQHRPDPWLTG
jgi:hypothetical protein